MQVIKYWDIQVWNGADRCNSKYLVASESIADQFLAINTFDRADEKSITIFDSFKELEDHINGAARRAALAKLTEADKIALGLKD